MSSVSAEELSRKTAELLRRAQQGERLTITVAGHPVAELAPVKARPASLEWEEFISGADQWRADPGLATELRHLVQDATDDARIR